MHSILRHYYRFTCLTVPSSTALGFIRWAPGTSIFAQSSSWSFKKKKFTYTLMHSLGLCGYCRSELLVLLRFVTSWIFFPCAIKPEFSKQGVQAVIHALMWLVSLTSTWHEEDNVRMNSSTHMKQTLDGAL